MRSAVVSAVILVILFVLVGVNTVTVDRMLSGAIEKVEKLDCEVNTKEDFESLKADYKRHAMYINLTVSHIMMSEVEEAFAELEGAISANNAEGITEAKSRLTNALGQLKRLAGVSFESII